MSRLCSWSSSALVVLLGVLCAPALFGAGPAREVAFVDGSLAGHEVLVAGVRPGVETVRLDPAGDALAQMAAWAETHAGYQAIHVLSHGAPGALRLGRASLDGAALRDPAVSGQLVRLGRALNRGGDLLLYGCSLAAGPEGDAYLAAMAQATGADVAGSTGPTGAARLGGDWTLEIATGLIEARPLVLGDFQGVLSTITFSDDELDLFGAHSTITRTETVSSQSITFTAAAGQRLTSYYDPEGSFGLNPLRSDGTGTYLKISAPAGYTFDLTSFAATISEGHLSITLTYGDGHQDSFTHSGSGTTLSTRSGFSPSIDNVTAVEISSSGADLFNDFAITDVKAAPTIVVTPANGTSVDDTAAADSFGNLTGTLTATPVGTATIVSYGITGGTSGAYDVDGSNYTISKVGSYGTLYLVSTGTNKGLYVYVPNAAAIETLSTAEEAGANQRVTRADIFAVTATDSVGATGENTGLSGVYISITGQNDRPEITSGASISVVEYTTSTVYTATATDRDAGQTLTYSLSGDDAWLFTIDSSTGAVRFNSPPDFEAPVDSDHNNVYDIAITATDDALVPNAFISDLNYNKSAPQVVAITVTADTTAPETTLIDTPASLSVSSSATFTFSGDDGDGSGVARFEASLDGGVYGTVTSPQTYSSLADGSHTFSVRAIDRAGNVDATPATYSWTIDTTAPAVPSIGALTAAAISGTAEPGATVEVFVNGFSVGTTTADVDGHWSLPASLPEGDHSLTATATDAAGNTGTVSSATTWTIDTTAPAVATISRTQPGPVTTANTLEWRVTFTEAVTGVDAADFTLMQVDGAATGTISSVAVGSSAAEYIVTATGVSGVGTLRLDVKSSGTGIADGASNALSGGFTLGQPYTCTRYPTAISWGSGSFSQLGDNSTANSSVPVDVLGTGALAGKTVVAVAVGASHSLALCSDGTVASWGCNWDGRLGDGSVSDSRVPVAVNTGALAGKTVVAVAAGDAHSLALCSDGTVAAWGSNVDGELGDDSTTVRAVPVAVNTVTGTSALSGKTVVAVAAGAYHSLALCSDGTVAAWGYNYHGSLGNNSTTDSAVPVSVNTASGTSALSGKTVVAVAAGGTHSLALCSDGTVAVWGRNDEGQLGNDATTDSAVPVSVNTVSGTSALAGKRVVAVSAGVNHSLALCSDGAVAAWGDNQVGQLGNSSTISSPVPVAVSTASGTSALAGKSVVAVAARAFHSLALCSDGTVAAWGANDYGQLGDNSTTLRYGPVAVNTAAGTSALSGKTVTALAVGSSAGHSLVLASPLAIMTAVATPAAGSYKAGDGLNFTLTLSGAVTVTGSPRLVLTVGSTTRYATYVSGSGMTSLVFTYAVQSGDTDADGIAVASTIDPNGGTLTDGAGWPIVLSLPSYTLPVIKVDTTAPDTAITAHPHNPSASGTASFSFGSADANASFEASLDGAAYAPVTSPAACTGLADGSHTFAVRAIDAAGNVDATPASYTWTIDTTVPSAPTIASVTPTGVSGTAEPGATVRVYNGVTLLGTATADASGNWSLAVTLADGSYSLTAMSSDAAGNSTSTTAPTTRTIDTVAPTLTPVTLVSSNATHTLAKAGDTLTLGFRASETIQTPTVTLAGETVTTTYDSGTSTWSATRTVAADDVEGAATFSIEFRDVAGNAGAAVSATTDASAVTVDLTAPETTFDGTPGAWSGSSMAMFDFIVGSGVAGYEASLDGAAYAPIFNPAFFNDLADGPHTLAVRAIDAAGNVDATPAVHSWTVDTIAPNAPTLASIAPTGVSGTAEPGATVRVYNGATLLGTATADASGDWSLTVTLADGSYSLTATSRDAAGNSTSTTAPTTRTIDTVAPTLTPVTLVSSNATPTLAKAGDTLTLTFRASETIQTPTMTLTGETVTATYDSATSTWSATHTVASGDAEGAVTFSIAFLDLAGNAGAAVSATTDSNAVSIDLTAPDTAITAQPANASASGTATFSFGSADATASFEASLDGAAYAPVTSPAACTGLADGSHTFAVRAVDAAGNVDATPASYTWTIDTTVPTTPAVPTTPSANTSTTKPTISGTAEAGCTVTILIDGTVAGTATADSSGKWSYTFTTALTDGSHRITITTTDAAGNTSNASEALSVTIDVTAPAAPEITTPAGYITNGTPTITGTAEANSTVKLYDGPTLMGTVTASGTSAWSYTPATALSEGSHTLTATATDIAGNTSNASTAVVLIKGIVPSIETQPTAKSVTAGSPVTLSVTATGSTTLTYTWQRSADNSTFTPVSTSTSADYTLASATVAATGYYRVVVSNSFGTVTSNAVHLSVTPAYSAATPDGYAAATTGGGTAASVLVLTAEDFKTQATSANAAVITVVGSLSVGTVNVASNKTIQGADADAILVGNLNLSGVSNVIIRGLTLSNPGTTIVSGAYTNGGDALTITGSSRVFVTHCTFLDSANRQLAILSGSDAITVSWCEFGTSSASLLHRHSVQIGAAGDTTVQHVTLHHNLWSTFLDQAMPLATSGQVHMYANLVNAAGNTSGSVASDGAEFLSEYNIYNVVANPLVSQKVAATATAGKIRAIGNTYLTCTGTIATGLDTVFTPSYSYEVLPASDLATVLDASAGNVSGAGYADAATGSATISGPASAVTPGDSFTLTSTVTGATPATYEWRRNHTVITGATGASYTVSSMMADYAATYTVAVTLSSGDVIVSTPAVVSLGEAPAASRGKISTGGGAFSPWTLGLLTLLLGSRLLRRKP